MGPVTFEDNLVMLHDATYDNDSRRLQIGKIKMKNKRVVKIWDAKIDIKWLNNFDVLKIH